MVGLRLCFCVSVDTAPLSSHPSVRWLRSLRCLRLGRRAPPHGQGICEFATTRKTPLAAGTTPRQVSPRIRYFLRTGMARVMKKPGLYAIAARAIFSVRANFFAPKFCGRAALPTAALQYLGVRRRNMVYLTSFTSVINLEVIDSSATSCETYFGPDSAASRCCASLRF